ncbi:hypothetical protein OWC43_00820 [Methylorubrum sp. POS3]
MGRERLGFTAHFRRLKPQKQRGLRAPGPVRRDARIADPGGLGSAISGAVGAAFADETTRTDGLTNPGGLSFGGGGGSFGLVTIPGTSLTTDVETGLTTGAIGFTGAGIGTGSNAPGLSRLESPGIGITGGGGGAPTGAGIAGAPGLIDADTDPFDGRGMR